MTRVFEKKRIRLRAMKALMGVYLPPDQVMACPKCGKEIARKEAADNAYVCPSCGRHWPLYARKRLKMILDDGVYRELNENIVSCDPLAFPGYQEKLSAAREKSGLSEAVIAAEGAIDGRRCVVCVLDSRFMMGSMGAAVGERIVRAIGHALDNRLPLIIFSASGGARMQEGMYSLMQMARTSAALKRFSEAGLLYISVLTDPTMGGVTASFASLGDVILAEPGALIGFAGSRVIEQTIGETLPCDFQRAEFMMKHGFIDAVIPRHEMRNALCELLMLHGQEENVCRAH